MPELFYCSHLQNWMCKYSVHTESPLVRTANNHINIFLLTLCTGLSQDQAWATCTLKPNLSCDAWRCCMPQIAHNCMRACSALMELSLILSGMHVCFCWCACVRVCVCACVCVCLCPHNKCLTNYMCLSNALCLFAMLQSLWSSLTRLPCLQSQTMLVATYQCCWMVESFNALAMDSLWGHCMSYITVI